MMKTIYVTSSILQQEQLLLMNWGSKTPYIPNKGTAL